ncbi:Glycosyltransferase involved in cell wall biosynthesis [Planctomycetales bacterium 10988]|nr:Glycosyltransferase involved in cell wall biosynthesis [Planctomycetales bacterium 10988]
MIELESTAFSKRVDGPPFHTAELAFVHDWLIGMRGGEKCLDSLVRHFPESPLYTLIHCREALSSHLRTRDLRASYLQKLPAVSRYYRGLLPLMPRAVEKIRLPKTLDLVVSMSHAVAKGISVPPGVPHLCYCFTPMRYAWILREEYLPEQNASKFGFKRLKRSLQNYFLDRIRGWDYQVAQNVTHFIAISKTVQKRIQSCYGRASEVIYPPVNTDFFTPSYQPREDFYLCVSALVPYKRVDLAVEACRRLKKKLIIIGQGPEAARLKQEPSDSIQWLGWQSNEAIRNYLRRAKALIFPGEEDFGIVPVEAMACGCPVIALQKGGATETVVAPESDREGTGLFFEESSVDSLCTTLERFETDREQVSSIRCREQSLRFSQQIFEEQMLRRIQSFLWNQLASPHFSDASLESRAA